MVRIGGEVMVYTDGKHLVADSVKELHDFASMIGIKKSLFHSDSRYPHYDLPIQNLGSALRNGAKQITDREMVDVLRRLRAR